MTRSARPTVLLIASDLGGTGGIQEYGRWLSRALRDATTCVTLDLALDGSRRGKARAALKALAALTRHRPRLLVLAHVSYGSLGLVGRLLGIPYVVVVYGIEIWGPRSRMHDLVLRLARATWSISRFTRDQVNARYRSARSAVVLGGAVDKRFFALRPKPPGHLRVLTVSRLDDLAYKGIDTCLDALRSLVPRHRVEYRVAGTGPAEPELRRMVERADATSWVHLLGPIGDDQLLDEYRRASAVVLLSRLRTGAEPLGEGLGLVLLEAAAAGVPAIGSRLDGSADAVVDGVTGFLLAPGDPQALAGCLESLALDVHRREMIGRSARTWVRAAHSVEAFGERVHDALEGALRS